MISDDGAEWEKDEGGKEQREEANGEEGIPVRRGRIDAAERIADCCTLAVMNPLLSAILRGFVVSAVAVHSFCSSSLRGTTRTTNNALHRPSLFSSSQRTIPEIEQSIGDSKRLATTSDLLRCETKPTLSRTYLSPPTRSLDAHGKTQSTMPPRWAPRTYVCIVCGAPAKSRCPPCWDAGIVTPFCSRDHQKLVSQRRETLSEQV